MNETPAATVPPPVAVTAEPADKQPSGDLTKFFRGLLLQGAVLQECHREDDYNVFAARLDEAVRERQDSPEWQSLASRIAGEGRQEPPCDSSLKTDIEVLEHEVTTLHRGWVKAHRHACTKDNCVLDGGPAHELAFATETLTEKLP